MQTVKKKVMSFFKAMKNFTVTGLEMQGRSLIEGANAYRSVSSMPRY